MSSSNAVRYTMAMAIAAGLASSGCSQDDCCSPFSPVYYAVAYGTVTQGGIPVTGIEVGAEVFIASCPVSGTATGNGYTRSGAGGAYRLLLSSASQAEGQCLRLIVAGAEPILQTLTGMPFTAEASAQVRDSIQIDIEVP
jgi:hypothetical protein